MNAIVCGQPFSINGHQRPTQPLSSLDVANGSVKKKHILQEKDKSGTISTNWMRLARGGGGGEP
jgi:hypothetical protein